MWRKKNPEIWVVFSVISSHLYPLRPTNILCNSILSQFMYFLCNVIWIPIMFLLFFPCSFCLTAEWSLSNNYSTSMSKPLVSFVIIFLRQFFVVFCVFVSKCPLTLMPSVMLWLSVHKPEFLEPDIQHIHSSFKKLESWLLQVVLLKSFAFLLLLAFINSAVSLGAQVGQFH